MYIQQCWPIRYRICIFKYCLTMIPISWVIKKTHEKHTSEIFTWENRIRIFTHRKCCTFFTTFVYFSFRPLSTTVNHHKPLPLREQQSEDQSFEMEVLKLKRIIFNRWFSDSQSCVTLPSVQKGLLETIYYSIRYSYLLLNNAHSVGFKSLLNMGSLAYFFF